MRSTTDLPPKVNAKSAPTLIEEVNRSSGAIDGRVVIECDGVAVGAFVPIQDVRGWVRLDEQEWAEFDLRLSEKRAAFADVPPDEIEREIELALAEVDAERAARHAVAAGQ